MKANLPTTIKRVQASSLVEVILAVSIFMAYSSFLIGALAFSISTTKIPALQKTAIRYASEGIEIARYIRGTDLGNLPDGIYGLQNTGTTWNLVTGAESIDSTYTRTITINSPNANEKLVTSSTTWNNSGKTGTESVTATFSNWQDQIIRQSEAWKAPTLNKYIQIPATTYDVTRLSIFDNTLFATLRQGKTNAFFTSFDVSNLAAITQGTNVAIGDDETDVAQVQSGATRRFYYTSQGSPLDIAGVDSASRTVFGTYNYSGSTATNGIAVTGTTLYLARDSGNQAEFAIMQNSGNSTFTTLGSLQSTDTYYDVAIINSSYVYVTTANTAKELVVINVGTQASPSIVKNIDIPSTDSGRFNLLRFGNYLLVYRSSGAVANSQLYLYNTTDAANPVLVTSYNLPYLVYDADIDTTRNLLFLVTSNPAAQLEILSLANPAIPTHWGAYSANNTDTYRSVAWDQTNDRIYIGTTDNTNEIIILNAQ